MSTTNLSANNLQKFLDSKQYTSEGITKYEIIFGTGFISAGGLEQIEWLSHNYLNNHLQQGSHVLDAGCGIGGVSEYLSTRYNAKVQGVDLSKNAIDIATATHRDNDKIQFTCGDLLSVKFSEASFDLIISRDSILHIQDKDKLFKNFFYWLKPGGMVVVSDYAVGMTENWTKEFRDYIKDRNYFLLDLQSYENVVCNAGFTDVVVKNCTPMFRGYLEREKSSLLNDTSERNTFLKNFSEEQLDRLLSGWDNKLSWVDEGYQRYCIISGYK